MGNANDKKISIGRLIITLCMLLFIIVGGTFAWLTYSTKQSALVLTIGDICNYAARNGADVTTSAFSNDVVLQGNTSNFTVPRLSYVDEISSLDNGACAGGSYVLNGVTTNLNCREAVTKSDDVVVSLLPTINVTAYKTTQNISSSDSTAYFYIPKYQCFVNGNYLKTGTSSVEHAITTTSAGCYDTCNNLYGDSMIPRQHNSSCYCCPSQQWVSDDSVSSSCQKQYEGLD